MELTIRDPDRVTETTVDGSGRISGLSDFKNERIKITVSRLENDEGGSE